MNEQNNVSNVPSNNTNMNNGFNMNPIYSNNNNTMNNSTHTNSVNHTSGFPTKDNTNIKKGNKKLLFILLPIIGVLVLVIGFFLFQLLFPKIYLSDFKDTYEYEEFNTLKKTVKSSLFVNKDETVWNINGYDFYQGKETTIVPVKFGDNTLIMTTKGTMDSVKFI